MNNVCNIEKFHEWLKRRLNVSEFDVKEYVEDLMRQYDSTDLAQYELNRDNTISGNPEYYPYKVEIVKTDDNDFETRFIL